MLSDFWIPYDIKLIEDGKFNFTIEDAVACKDKIYVMVESYTANQNGTKKTEIHVLKKDMSREEILTIPREKETYISGHFYVSEKYIVVPSREGLSVYDIAKKTWKHHSAVGRGWSNVLAIDGDNVLLSYDITHNGTQVESGFTKMNLVTGKCQLLASSRRKPPLNALDNIAPYSCDAIFRLDSDKFIARAYLSGEHEDFIIDGTTIHPLESMDEKFFKRYVDKIYITNGSYHYLRFKSTDGKFFLMGATKNKILEKTAEIPFVKLYCFVEEYQGTTYEAPLSSGVIRGDGVIRDDFILTYYWIYYDMNTSFCAKIPVSFSRITSILKKAPNSINTESLPEIILLDDKIILQTTGALISFSVKQLKETAEKIRYLPDISLGNKDGVILAGDWNGDGRDGIWMRKSHRIIVDDPVDGKFDFIYSYGSGKKEKTYLVGDWDGTGKDKIAVARGKTVLMDTNYDGKHDIEYSIKTDFEPEQFLAGKWQGDKKDSIAFSNKNIVYFDDDGDGTADRQITYANFASPDEFVSGDFDGDGKDDIFIRRGNKFLIDSDLDGKIDSEFIANFAKDGDIYLIGDWDGDGKDSIAVWRDGKLSTNSTN
jgi:hypothetical protein